MFLSEEKQRGSSQRCFSLRKRHVLCVKNKLKICGYAQKNIGSVKKKFWVAGHVTPKACLAIKNFL